MRMVATFACLIALVLTACGDRPEPEGPMATSEAIPGSPTVADTYPLLASGALVHARLGDLPEGVLLRAEGTEITAAMIAGLIAEQPSEFRAELSREEFFVVEQEAERMLMVAIGRQMLGEDGDQTDQAALMEFVHNAASGATVAAEEVRAFYDANRQNMGGATFEQIADHIEQYLLGEARTRAIESRIRELGRETEIAVSSSWIAAAARKSADNPVDGARRSGRPSMAVFGGTACCGTDFRKPLVERMSAAYGEKMNLIALDTAENQVLAARCGVRSIPTVILYGVDGVERERLSGHVDDDEVAAALARMGIR